LSIHELAASGEVIFREKDLCDQNIPPREGNGVFSHEPALSHRCCRLKSLESSRPFSHSERCES
jgi:hypothetical protein